MFGKQDKMDVRCSSETEANRVSKNGHKEGKESKGSEGNISTSFLKDQQGTFSASTATEDCNKSKSSSADPDYCRRILVRGMSSRYLARVGEGELSSRPGDLLILLLCLRSVPGWKNLRMAPEDRSHIPAGLCPAAPSPSRLYSAVFPPAARGKVKPRWFLPGFAPHQAGPSVLCGFAAFPGCPSPQGPRRDQRSLGGAAALPLRPGALLPRPRIPPAYNGAGPRFPPGCRSGQGRSSPEGRGSGCPPFPRARHPSRKGYFKITIILKINGEMTKGFLIFFLLIVYVLFLSALGSLPG